MKQPTAYYVSYSHTLGFGAIDVTLTRPVRTAADVWVLAAEVQRQAQDNGQNNAVVLNYQLINPPATVDTATIAGLVSAAQHDLATGTTPKTILTGLLAELYKISR